MEKYGVTVVCMAYNHGKYIAQTLEGFVRQKTNFPYIAIVHDDASTDDTAEIIRRYENKYPNIIKGIYQKENQYSQKISIGKEFIVPMIDSKYVAMCEGDDYWTDENKLQAQYDALEQDKTCDMCVHRVAEVTEDGQDNGVMYPPYEMTGGRIESRPFIEMCENYIFHTSSYFMRADEWKQYMGNPPEFRRVSTVGDICSLLYFGQLANVFYINKVMSRYRRGVATAWSMQMGNPRNTDKYLLHLDRIILTMEKFNQYTQDKYADLIKKRIANYYFSKCILSEKTRKIASDKSAKDAMSVLSYKKKVYLIFAALFPKTAKKHYLSRDDRQRNRRFYNGK